MPDRLSNSEALEELIKSLEVTPSVAQIAAGRTLAALCDAEPSASMISEYRDWLTTVESATVDEPDELDID